MFGDVILPVDVSLLFSFCCFKMDFDSQFQG